MDQELSAIDGLPNEILLIIFSNISCHQLITSVSKVCRRWKHLVSQLTLRIMYDGDDAKMHGGLMALLVTNFVRTMPDASVIVYRVATLIPHLKELTISEDYCLDVAQLKIIETLHNLRHLDIFTTKQNLSEQTPIPRNVNSLVVNNNMALGFLRKLEKQNRVIKAFHMYGRSTHCPFREIESFLKNYSVCLCELTLRCSELGDSSYETISQCKGLTSLQMYSCSQLRFKGACHLTYLTKLRRLHVTGTRMIRTNSLMQFIKNLPPRIVELNLSYSWFGDEHCNALLARLPNLRFLELWRSRVSVFHLVRLAEQLTSLEELDTDAIFLRGHIKFLNAHPSLKNIRCRWIDQIKTRFHIKSAEEKILAQYLRLDEEGPRGGLFYYWLQDSSIRTPLDTPDTPDTPVRRGSYLVRRTSDFDLYEGPLFGNTPQEN